MIETSPTGAPSFGDKVRILVTEETEAAGIAGLCGQVYGETTPSLMDVEVIGRPTSDFALNVYLTERGEAYWLAPELIEFVDHAPGTEISLEGVPKKWIREESGEWREEPALVRKWWQLWK